MTKSRPLVSGLIVAAIILSGCNQSTKTQTSHSTKTQTKSNQPAAVAPKSSSTPSQPIIQSVVASIHGQPYGKGLQAVRFVSSTTGYMAGNGIILKTADGGQIFTTAAHASVNLTGLSVARTTTATVAAWGNHSILVSHNSGSNWSASTLPHTVQQVDFATSSIGFAITGHQGSPAGYAAFPAWVLWRTIDGGAHWIQVPTSSPPASISFGAASVGWMSTANGDIFRTVNSGQTWSLVTQIPTTNAESTSLKPFVSLHAASAQICWALVVGGSGMNQASYSVFRTTNGTNWSPVLATSTAGAGPAPGNPGKVPPGPGSSPGPMAVVGGSSSAVLAGECRACGFGTTSVSSTQNAGASWNNFPTIQNGGASISMSFVSPSEGWLLDSSGADIFTLLQTL
ncbi:MAG: WD40/YVTN/BNR-like repeat-containing protein, partial [Ferrimicrobium acidiphilum]